MKKKILLLIVMMVVLSSFAAAQNTNIYVYECFVAGKSKLCVKINEEYYNHNIETQEVKTKYTGATVSTAKPTSVAVVPEAINWGPFVPKDQQDITKVAQPITTAATADITPAVPTTTTVVPPAIKASIIKIIKSGKSKYIAGYELSYTIKEDGKDVLQTVILEPMGSVEGKRYNFYTKDKKGNYEYISSDIDYIDKLGLTVSDKDKIKEDLAKKSNIDTFEKHQKYLAWLQQQRQFTALEGINLGSNIWTLGTSWGWWSEKDNPMFAINKFFEENTFGQFLSGDWEEAICRIKTDFLNGEDALIDPESLQIGAWVAAQKTRLQHPSEKDPNKMETEYLYRITMEVIPSSLAKDNEAGKCTDVVQFQILLGGKPIDIDGDNKTDTIAVWCDASAVTYTGTKTIVEKTKRNVDEVCLQFFRLGDLKDVMADQLSGGKLCQDIPFVGTKQEIPSSGAGCFFFGSCSSGSGGSSGDSGGRTPPVNMGVPGVSN